MIDNYDNRRLSESYAWKRKLEFELGAELAFEGAAASTITEFCDLAAAAARDPNYFIQDQMSLDDVSHKDGWITFPSGITTEFPSNDIVWTKVKSAKSQSKALIVLNHWGADKRNHSIANFFALQGFSVFEMALPYHFERSREWREGAQYDADFFVSPNLGRTIRSMRQAVWDARKLVAWLKHEGYGEITVVGMSLGSWVAGLLAAHEPLVNKASLFLTAGCAARSVWTGGATRLVRESIEAQISYDDFVKAWAPINVEHYAAQLARPNLDLQILLAKRDIVILPEVSGAFVVALHNAGARPELIGINCGHHSLGVFPFSLMAGMSVRRLLRRKQR